MPRPHRSQVRAAAAEGATPDAQSARTENGEQAAWQAGSGIAGTIGSDGAHSKPSERVIRPSPQFAFAGDSGLI